MSGRPYGIRELKLIVDYLVEHKAYGQVKARNMWKDFANSQLTNRTWQSLKEAFLKRILPDINNPYYKLTPEQIESFKRGCDIEQTEKRRLERRKEREVDTSANDKTQEDKEEPTICIKIEAEKIAGEDVISKTLSECHSNRTSTDTVVLEDVYETAEEIQKVLESPTNEKKNEPKNKSSTKTLRDLITYTEPLTPILQEVLDDFASESEEDCMQIVEDIPGNSEPEKIPNNTDIAVEKTKDTVTQMPVNDMHVSAHEINVHKPFRAIDLQNVIENNVLEQIDCALQEKSTTIEKVAGSNCQNIINLCSENDSEDMLGNMEHSHTNTSPGEKCVTNSSPAEKCVTNSSPGEKCITNSTPGEKRDTNSSSGEKYVGSVTQNCSHNTTDSVLPNNQEALDANKSTAKTINSTEIITCIDITEHPTVETQNRMSSTSIENSENTTEMDGKLKETTEKVIEKQASKDNDCKGNEIELITDKTFDKVNNTSSHQKNDSNEYAVTSHSTESVKKTNVENPCLQSVNLYTENLDTGHVSDTSIAEMSATNQDASNKVSDVATTSVGNKVVVLNSHSESSNTPPKCSGSRPTTKVQRHKALANLFGFTGGTVSTTRKAKLRLRRRRSSRHNVYNDDNSSSSEWMSEDDSASYIDPPRARKHRVTRKFLKPQSAQILSLEEEGGLFVIYGKKIFPLVKDGKLMKNYVTYTQDSDSEIETETYWKKKYDEEKKKAEKLEELLNKRAREPSPIVISPQQPHIPRSLNKAKEPSPRVMSPPPPPPPPPLPRESISRDTEHRKRSTSSSGFGKETGSHRIGKEEPTEVLKIKFAKNNEEFQVEGHWAQINAVLEQVVHTFNKYTDVRTDNEKKTSVSNGVEDKLLHSRLTTPEVLDPDVQNKVNQIEDKIFEEIEQMHEEEATETIPENNNVTVRRGKGRKISTSSASSLPKKARVSPVPENNVANNVEEDQPRTPRHSSRIPKKATIETATNVSPVETVQTRNSRATRSRLTFEENETRYMLPPNSRKSNTKSSLDRNKKEKANGRSSADLSTSLDNTLLKSDSTQAYRDSDDSPVVNHKRKKRNLKYSTQILKTQRRNRKLQRIIENAASDSSNSSFSGPVKNDTENSSVYKSESYKILMGKMHPVSVMEVIDEDNTTAVLPNIEHFDTIPLDRLNKNTRSSPVDEFSMHSNSDNSSSMVSLPISPVLSIVDNISVHKDSLHAFEQPNKDRVNTPECMSFKGCASFNEISDLIATRVIVNKDGELRKMSIDSRRPTVSDSFLDKVNRVEIREGSVSDAIGNRRPTISDSFLDKVNRVEIREGSVSDTIGRRLGNLLLDTAKKISTNIEIENMELDASESTLKKNKTKKRCSTPRKRKSLNNKFNQVADVIQEHVETYSSKSHQPTICIHECGDNVMSDDVKSSISENNKKVRKRKDVIKVKILKPKKKSESKRISLIEPDLVYDDSGINNTKLEHLHASDDSVEFIHNHSDTCIHINECMEDDNVKFVTLSESAVSLNNMSTQSCHAVFGRQPENKPQDILNTTSWVSALVNDSGVPGDINQMSKDTLQSPILTEASYNSLITDDLSDEITTTPNPVTKPANWYLLSEDDTTNFINKNDNNCSVGSDLNKLFPIALAVPNLSTISELSRENAECNKKSSNENVPGS